MTPPLGTARSTLCSIRLFVQLKSMLCILVFVKGAPLLLAILGAIGVLLSSLSMWLVSVNIRASFVLRPVSVIIGLKESRVARAYISIFRVVSLLYRHSYRSMFNIVSAANKTRAPAMVITSFLWHPSVARPVFSALSRVATFVVWVVALRHRRALCRLCRSLSIQSPALVSVRWHLWVMVRLCPVSYIGSVVFISRQFVSSVSVGRTR